MQTRVDHGGGAGSQAGHPAAGTPGGGAGGQACPTCRQGSQGLYVAYLQNLLNERLRFRTLLWVDGIFGPKTDAAVRLFQMSSRLQVDGVVGPATWAALEAGPPPIRKRPARQLIVPATAGA